MLDCAGGELAAQSDFAGDHALLAGVVEAVGVAAAIVGSDGEVGQRIVFPGLAGTQRRPAGQVLREVLLATQATEGVLLPGVGPGLCPVGGAVSRCWHGRDRAGQRHVGARGFQVMVLVAQIGRQARVGIMPVQAGPDQVFLVVFAVDGGVALAVRGHQTQAGAVIGPEAAGQVGRGVELLAVDQPQVHTRQRIVGGTLGQQVDGAADAAAAGCGARQEGTGAAQHLHTLEKVGGDVLAGQQAEQAVVGNIVRIQQEAAHEIGFLEVAEAARHPDGRIVLQHIGHALGLLVLDQLVGVGGDREGRLHLITRAQDANTAATSHLAAGQRLRQSGGRGIGAGADLHGVQHDGIRVVDHDGRFRAGEGDALAVGQGEAEGEGHGGSHPERR